MDCGRGCRAQLSFGHCGGQALQTLLSVLPIPPLCWAGPAHPTLSFCHSFFQLWAWSAEPKGQLPPSSLGQWVGPAVPSCPFLHPCLPGGGQSTHHPVQGCGHSVEQELESLEMYLVPKPPQLPVPLLMSQGLQRYGPKPPCEIPSFSSKRGSCSIQQARCPFSASSTTSHCCALTGTPSFATFHLNFCLWPH